ncbi:ParB N-terminal domain-containing protein [Paenibacillus graminis]|uniref:ParB N-terminal domain-containing protein n=1 Tax=Paenibacillus graminis TaxID=189425 RepID=UPI000470ECE3|nr:ParB N-terminal domain-containing protein [Paenibacillus graminis]
MLTPIKSINIGTRIREDMGDIAGLAESIQARGLLHPIIIDEAGNLIAGHRRLEAHKLLGREEVETRTLADLTEREKRLIELEENTKRKALTEFEASKNLTELAEAAKDVLREEFLPKIGNNPPEGGRPAKPDSEAKVAERLGVPRQTINDAKQHVNAVEKYPALENLNKIEAIITARDPEKAEQYQKAIEDFPQLAEAKVPVDLAISGAEKLRQAPPEMAKERLDKLTADEKKFELRKQLIDEQYRDAKIINNLIDAAVRIRGTVTEERMMNWMETRRDRSEIELSMSQVQGGIDEFQRLKDQMKAALKGPRRVGK